jgi:hypothetical protein
LEIFILTTPYKILFPSSLEEGYGVVDYIEKITIRTPTGVPIILFTYCYKHVTPTEPF